MTLVDTDIMIDVLREFAPALVWFYNLDDEIALPGFVVMELIQGSTNKTEQVKVTSVIRRSKVVWPSSEASDKALHSYAQFHLSHQLGLLDSLIAQTAIEQRLPLHMFNTKHYRGVSLLKTIQPFRK